MEEEVETPVHFIYKLSDLSNFHLTEVKKTPGLGSKGGKGSAGGYGGQNSVIASFTEEFPLYGIMTYPFRAVLSGKIKAIKNTNKALINFDEMIVNDESSTIETFPVFVDGDLRESLFKEIALSFFESLPSILASALRTQIPQAGVHFINTDLQNKVRKLSVLETEKQTLQYLELKDIKLLKLVIK